jgi:hypothetical protein
LIYRLAFLAVCFNAFILAMLGVHAVNGFLSRISPTLFVQDPLLELLDWSDLKVELKDRGLLQGELFIFGLD